MEIEIPKEKKPNVRFYEVRKHIFKHRKTHRKNLTPSQINERKRQARLGRIALANSSEGIEFFNWIFSIKEGLGLNSHQFCSALGISLQTEAFWRKRRGHFPSHETYRKLEEMEKLLRIKVESK